MGDTLWTIDTNLRRISYFSATDGRLLATERYASDASLATVLGGFYFPYPERLLGDGTMVGFGGTAGRMIADGQVTQQPTLRLTRAGRTLDTIAWASLVHRSLIIRSGSHILYAPLPFSDGSMVAYAAAAERIYVIDRTTATSGSHGEYGVAAIRTNGDTLWSRRYSYQPRRIDDHVADSVRRRIHRAYGGRFTAAEIDEALFVPEFFTPITAAVAGDDGTLWLRREDSGSATAYDVIGADGILRGQVSTPRNTRLHWVSGSVAWGEERDADDVPVLVRYRVVWP